MCRFRLTTIPVLKSLTIAFAITITVGFSPLWAKGEAKVDGGQLDVVYGEVDGQSLKLDVFRPSTVVDGKMLPAVIFVHGGGWSSGDKKDFRNNARQLAEQGYVTFSIGYRLFTKEGKNRWPAQIDDVQRAVRWIKSQADRFGIDPQRIGAVGGSAGGHLVSLLGTTDTRDNSIAELSGFSSRVNCVVNIFGPSEMGDDFAPKVEGGAMVNQLLFGLFGGDRAKIPEVVKAASPLYQVSADDAPFLTFHGTLDKLVPLDHSERLHEALQKVNVESTLTVFKDEGHGFQKEANRAQFAREVVDFFNRHLKPVGKKGNVFAGTAVSDQLRKRLQSGEGEPVKIVCFGDSVTGLYYHTGGQRTYTDMLGIALRQLHPQAKLEMINAGISGHTTDNGLARMAKDVLAHQPDVVTIMFGLNDLAKTGKPEAFGVNLVRMIGRCRAAGAEVILCTPNSVMDNEPRPLEKLKVYCDVVRQVAKQQQVPLCDTFSEFEAMRARDPLAWRLTLSDEIHPNMAGHKVIAEQLAEVISGSEVSLADVGPPQPAIGHTIQKLKAGKLVRVLAMPPFDSEIATAFQQINPDAKVEVTVWETEGKTLRELEKEASKRVRPMKPDLVLIAVPRASSQEPVDQQAWIRSQYWLVNYSLSFGNKEWDTLVVHPSVWEKGAGERDNLVRKLVAAHDLPLIDRADGDEREARAILHEWVKLQGESR